MSLSVVSDKVQPAVVPRWSVTTGSPPEDEPNCNAPPTTVKVMTVALSATAGVILVVAEIDRMTKVIAIDADFMILLL